MPPHKTNPPGIGTGGNPRPRSPKPRTLRTGFEQLAAQDYAQLTNQRVGIVTNPTGITRDAHHIVDVMHADPHVNLVAVFGPEHGFRGTAQAGSSEGYSTDPATGLPVYDTYVKSGAPRRHLQDRRRGHRRLRHPGRRRPLLHLHLDPLRLHGGGPTRKKRFVVLDRPNPVTGRSAQGPVLHREFATFVGRQPIAQAHGMTVAELARLFNGEFLTKPVPWRPY